MIRKLLLASSLVLSIEANAHAYDASDDGLEFEMHEVCFQASAQKDDDVCIGIGEEDILTAAEQRQIALIIRRAQKREEIRLEAERAQYRKERAIEDDRRSKCAVPLLWIKCPERTPEAQRYWTARGK
jgi:hypothetical protein